MSRVAVIQMVSGPDWQENLAMAASLLKEASDQGAELALLPENFAVFHTSSYQERGRAELTADGPIRQFLATQAKTLQLTIIGGSIPILSAAGDRVRAASIVVDPNGREVSRYDKVHLFDVDVDDAHASYRESDQMEPGSTLQVVETQVGKVGLSICYDLRFPLLYQDLVEQQAELITVPAAFTQVTGEAHWHVLLRARAIETQCYILAADQGGRHSKNRTTYGHSMIIDPWGRVLAELTQAGPGVAVAEICLEELHGIRKRMPVQQHRRQFTNC